MFGDLKKMVYTNYFKTVSPPLLFTVLDHFGSGAPVCLDYIGIVVLWHGTVDSRQPLQPGSGAKVDSFAPRQGEVLLTDWHIQSCF